MSTESDMAVGAGLLGMLSGMRDDRLIEKDRAADLVRQEGLMRLRERIANENSASGWVNKQTGAPILKSELGNVTPESRMTASDFALMEAERINNKQWEWGEKERNYNEEQRRKDISEEEERYYKRRAEEWAHDLDVAGIRSGGARKGSLSDDKKLEYRGI